MPGDPRECRLHAVKCLELARSAKSKTIKNNFVNLAATWQALVNQLEAQQALVEKIADEDSDMRTAGTGPAARTDTGC
jgi:hypothetical protein